MGLGEKILKFWEKSLCAPARGAMLNIGGKNLLTAVEDKKGPDPNFFCLLVKSFRPPFRPQKKKKWFMLKQGLNCNFNFYIVKNWSASWWPNLVTNIVFDLMGLLWDVCWPHWPNLAKIRRPPSVRSVSLTTGLAVKGSSINYVRY